MNSKLFNFVFLATFAYASAAIFSHPLRRHIALRSNVEKTRLRAQRLAKVSSPLGDRNNEDNYYTIDVQVGTPPQTFTVGIDTNFSTLVLQSKQCALCTPAHSGDNYTARLFDESKSSTFKRGQLWQDQYGFNAGYMGNDTVKISTLTVQSQEFALAEKIYKDLVYKPIDGLLGLGWPSAGIDGARPFFQDIAKKLDAPVYTIYLGHYVDFRRSQVDGQITFGGKDTQNCDSSWSYLPISSPAEWIVQLSGFQFGKYVAKQKHQALFNTQQSRLLTPGYEFNSILTATGAVYDYDIIEYTVDCAKIAQYPPIVVNLGGGFSNSYSIQPTQYIIKNFGGYGKCVLDLGETFNGGWEPQWTFGGAFLRSYCQAYDFGQKRIGLALATHKDS